MFFDHRKLQNCKIVKLEVPMSFSSRQNKILKKIKIIITVNTYFNICIGLNSIYSSKHNKVQYTLIITFKIGRQALSLMPRPSHRF